MRNESAGYGSLDKYNLCSSRQKKRQPVVKLVICALFFAACVYFALMLTAYAQTTTKAQINEGGTMTERTHITKNISYISHSKSSVLNTGDRLPLLQRPAPAAYARDQNRQNRTLKTTGSSKKAKAAMMMLALLSGTQYALTAPARQAATQPPLPKRKPARDGRNKTSTDLALDDGGLPEREIQGRGNDNACCVSALPRIMMVNY